MSSGPEQRSPDGLVDLTPVAKAFGLQGQVMIDPDLWGTYCCAGGDAAEKLLMHSLIEGMDKLLVSERADYAWFDFKHWYRKSSRSTKNHWVRLRATMYMNDEGTPWVHLTESPKRAHRWRGHSLD